MSVQKDRIMSLLSALQDTELTEVRDELNRLTQASSLDERRRLRAALEQRSRASGWATSGPVGAGKCPCCGR